MTQPVDKSILQEIVRIIEAQRKVPEKVVVRSREYVITYLEDHMNRLQEALRRYDSDRLNMLYGQLASKVKYQMHRMVASRAKEPAKKEPEKKEPAKAVAAKSAAKPKPSAAPVKKAAKKAAAKRPAAKKPAAKKAVAAKKATRKVAKKPAARAKAARQPAAKKKARAAAKSHK